MTRSPAASNRLVLPALLALIATVCAQEKNPVEVSGPPKVIVPEAAAPRVDGKHDDEEWKHGAHFALGKGGHALARVMLLRAGRDLYLSCRSEIGPWSVGLRFTIVDPVSEQSMALLVAPLHPPKAPVSLFRTAGRDEMPERVSVATADVRFDLRGAKGAGFVAEMRLPLDLLEIGRTDRSYAVRGAAAAEILGMTEPLDRISPAAQLFRVAPAQLRELGRLIGRALDALRAGPGPLGSPGLDELLAFELPAAILTTLATSSPSPSTPRLHNRRRALTRACAFIMDRLQEPPSVREVCRASGVSWRTLDYAFRDHFGVTPKAYLQALRLNAVRRELLAAEPGARVADIANRWGFWHAGQFAADYRKLFGELPSGSASRASPARPPRGAPPEV